MGALRALPIALCDPKSLRFERELAARLCDIESIDEHSNRTGAEIEKFASEFARRQREALSSSIASGEASTRELLAEWDEAIHAGDMVADAAKQFARSFRYVPDEASLDDLRSRLSKEMETLIFIVQERDRFAKASEARFEEIRQTALRQLATFQEWTSTDSLTNLANRASHELNLQSAIASAKNGEPTSMALVAIDGLDTINEDLGFRAGDVAIISFARELDRTIGAQGSVARLYGGCFATNFNATSAELRAVLSGLAFRLQDSMINLGEESRSLSFHFGAVEVDGSKGYDETMAHAEMELKASMRRARSLKAAS